MIVRTQDVKFTVDRKPQPRRVKLGFEGDNAVERLRFALPDLGEGQTATLMMSGAYANAVTLKADAGKWSVDLTAEVIGKSGEVAAYVRTENGGDIWQSDVIMLETGKVPDAEGDIEQRYPTAVGQMLTAMAEHSVEMEEQVKRAEDAADRAEAAGSGGGGTGGADGEDGGYYQPSVSADGDLSWSASKPDMPEVETVNIRGPVGPEGRPGRDGVDGQPGRDGTDAEVTKDNIAAALGYTPADKRKVDQLSEEKADKSEITAPYTLPTASDMVKGGVMVGDDFVMDGETLRKKPENEYELIETIAVGYRLLSQKPDDWETNWSAYYKADNLSTGIAALSSKTSWEPYKYYKDEGDVNVRSVSRHSSPDGTPYNFKAVVFKLRFELSNVSSGAVNCSAGEKVGGGGQVATINSALQGRVTWSAAMIEVANGYATAQSAYPTSNFYGANSMHTASISRFITKLAYIGSIGVTTAVDAPIPKGSVFEIWGVRA